jgi:hypothetical protein
MNANNHNGAAAKASLTESLNELRLSTARKRLAASRDQQDALEGMREIVGTFLGSEEIGLFTFDSRTTSFHVFWSFGINLENYDLHKALGDSGRERVMRGEYHVNLSGHDHTGKKKVAQAFIPISFDGQTVAILAILRLLPQKNGFDRSDFELFQLLTHEAGAPLFGRNVSPKTSNNGPGMRA